MRTTITIIFALISAHCFPQKFLGDYENGTPGKENQFLQFCDSSNFFYANNYAGLFVITGDPSIPEETDMFRGKYLLNQDTISLYYYSEAFLTFQIIDSLNLKVISSKTSYCTVGEHFNKYAEYYGELEDCNYFHDQIKWIIHLDEEKKHLIRRGYNDSADGFIEIIYEEKLPLTVYKH